MRVRARAHTHLILYMYNIYSRSRFFSVLRCVVALPSHLDTLYMRIVYTYVYKYVCTLCILLRVIRQ